MYHIVHYKILKTHSGEKRSQCASTRTDGTGGIARETVARWAHQSPKVTSCLPTLLKFTCSKSAGKRHRKLKPLFTNAPKTEQAAAYINNILQFCLDLDYDGCSPRHHLSHKFPVLPTGINSTITHGLRSFLILKPFATFLFSSLPPNFRP